MQTPIIAEDIFTWAAAGAAILSVVAGVAFGLASGTLKRISFGGISIEGGLTPEIVAELKKQKQPAHDDKPFEVVALSNYYNHALLRANVSFWFSLVFAAVGFGVIIFAFATHNQADLWGTVVKAVSGTVIDAVSALFFVQSTNAQKAMSEFFEKLRLDRLNAEARSLISEIENSERRDQLRAQLVLKYAAIDKLLVG